MIIGVGCVLGRAMAVSPRLLEVAARIDRYVDLIPSRYYLNENQQSALKDEDPKKKKRSSYDPEQRKTTSQLLAEAGGAAPKQVAASGSKKKKAKKQKLKESASGENGLSRNELREKLQSRIAELKDERKRRQSERDKAKAKAARDAPENGESKKRKEIDVSKNAVVDDDVDAGKLDFEPQAAELPFEATVNARGAKARRLQQAIREEDVRKKKLAAVAGDAEAEAAVNREVRMQRALARARGEKVHDDVSRLRRSAKQVDKRKKKTKENWNLRVDAVEKSMKEKQKTRKDNIAKKVASKKKNQNRGFEGKVEGYLNKD